MRGTVGVFTGSVTPASSKAMNRPISFLVIVLALNIATLTGLAHATPPDQTWISGWYDNADYDDVVLDATSALATANSREQGVRRIPHAGEPRPVFDAPSTSASDVELSTPRSPPSV